MAVPAGLRNHRAEERIGFVPRSSFIWPEQTTLQGQLSNMSLTMSIPRFLLPQRGLIWRARLSAPSATSRTIRHASSKTAPKKKSSKPLVLEKPTKFNPPSHGSRLPREAPRYPGPQLSAEDIARQKTNKYPSMMPPDGSFMHWFLTNKALHMYISLVRRSPFILKALHLLTLVSDHTLHACWHSICDKFPAQLSLRGHDPTLAGPLPAPHQLFKTVGRDPPSQCRPYDS